MKKLIRIYFAGQAMKGLLSCMDEETKNGETFFKNQKSKGIADFSWIMADAMIERKDSKYRSKHW